MIDSDEGKYYAEAAVVNAAREYVKALTTPAQYSSGVTAAQAKLIAAVSRLEAYER